VLQASSTFVLKDGTPATIERGVNPLELSIVSTNPATSTWTSAFTCDGWDPLFNRAGITTLTNNTRTQTYYSSINGKLNSGFYLNKDAELKLIALATRFTNEVQEVYSSTEIEYLNGDRPGFL
jgi:hypothetical protein